MQKNTTTPATTEAEEVQVMYSFNEITLTDAYHLKVTGTMFRGKVSEEFTREVNQAPALSLLRVLQRLTLHMALLTESVSAAQLFPDAEFPEDVLRDAVSTAEVYQHEGLLNFRCTSVLFKSKGTVLVGERRTKYKCFGKAVEVKTPPTVAMSFDEEEDNYPFFEEWHQALGDLRAEAQAYLEGQYGDGTEQLHLFSTPEELAQADAQTGSPLSGLQGIVDSAQGFTSLTISSSAGSVTLEKGQKPKRTFQGKELEDE